MCCPTLWRRSRSDYIITKESLGSTWCFSPTLIITDLQVQAHLRFWPESEPKDLEAKGCRTTTSYRVLSATISKSDGVVTNFMAQEKHLKLEDLGEDIKEVLIACGNKLKNAPFKINKHGFEFIEDRKTWEEASRDFVAKSSPKVSLWGESVAAVSDLNKPECRLIAWRFRNGTTLTVPLHVTMDLIPCATSETAKIGGESVVVGQSRHLTRDTEIEPSLTCLARVYGHAS